MSRTSGLSQRHRVSARSYAISAGMVGYNHRSSIHYPASPADETHRFEGISLRKIAVNNEYPTMTDCSGFVTWCLWNGLGWRYDIPDIVSDRDWIDGWTGSMYEHGIHVVESNLQRADAIFYGDVQTPDGHVALYAGGGKVISHGSEAGPYFLPIDYRGDRVGQRRYI